MSAGSDLEAERNVREQRNQQPCKKQQDERKRASLTCARAPRSSPEAYAALHVVHRCRLAAILTCVGTFDSLRMRIAASIASPAQATVERFCPEPVERRKQPRVAERLGGRDRGERHEKRFVVEAPLEGVQRRARSFFTSSAMRAQRGYRRATHALAVFRAARLENERHRSRVGKFGQTAIAPASTVSVPACVP